MEGWDVVVTVSEGPEMESDRDRAEWGLDQGQDSDLASFFGDCSWSGPLSRRFHDKCNRTQFTYFYPAELREAHPYRTRRIMLLVQCFLNNVRNSFFARSSFLFWEARRVFPARLM